MKINHIVKQIESEITPIEVFNNIKDKKGCFILDSIEGSGGTKTLIGFDPFLTLKSRKSTVVEEKRGKENELQGNPFDILKNYLKNYSLESITNTDIPYGGAVGFLGYSMGYLADTGSGLSGSDYDFHMGFYDSFIIYDHIKRGYLLLTINIINEDNSLLNKKIQELEKILIKQDKLPDILYSKSNNGLVKTTIEKNDYKNKVKKIKEYISAGDIYQANFSQQFKIKIDDKAFEIYNNLRALNPVRYAAFMKCDEKIIISMSPEQFLKINGNNVQTSPIKGTRPRGTTRDSDQLMVHELINSAKDNAELLMIVDLERNDLGRVCEPRSIKVNELKRLETFATVHHLVASISGKLRENQGHVDCIRACFPGGSITGAPKIRSMEIIEELEAQNRGVYCGAIGYIGFNKCTELNIAIRTAVAEDGELTFYSGAGIVADSDPENEYQETLVKVKSFFEVISGTVV